MKQYFAAALFTIAVSASSVTFADINQTPKFMAVTDVHFNPDGSCADTKPCAVIEKLRQADVAQWESILATDDTSAPKYQTDTNYAFLKSTLTELNQRANQENPAFVVVLGDYLAHNFKQNFL